MKIKPLLLFILLSFFAISCDRDEVKEPMVETETLPATIKKGFLYPDLSIINPGAVTFKLIYDSQNRLVKNVGGFLPLSGSTGFNASFSNQVYTSLIYDNNKVTVEDFSSSPDFTILKNSKYFTLNAQNKIEQKEMPSAGMYWYRKDLYSYKNGLLDEIKTTLPNMPYDPNDPDDYILSYAENFFYDASGNLTKTEYFEQHNGINVKKKTVRQFENYDTSSSPFKPLQLLDEYFYRSLSENNFRTYKEFQFNYGEVVSSKNVEWSFDYDSTGKIIIN